MAFTPVGDALQKKMQANGSLQENVEAADVLEAAKETFDTLFAEEAIHVKPLFVKNRTLTVTCSSSVIAQEIRLNQAKIVSSINQKLDTPKVDRIRYLS